MVASNFPLGDEGAVSSDDPFAALCEGIDRELIVDLLVAISFYRGVVRVLGAIEIDVESEYQHYLSEFSFPTAVA